MRERATQQRARLLRTFRRNYQSAKAIAHNHGSAERDARPHNQQLDLTLHGGATILLVEPNEDTRHHLSTVLRLIGYNVIEAPHESIAIGFAGIATSIDVACLTAPTAAAALEFMTRLRERRPELKLILMTDEAESEPACEIRLSVPVSDYDLIQALPRVLGRIG